MRPHFLARPLFLPRIRRLLLVLAFALGGGCETPAPERAGGSEVLVLRTAEDWNAYGATSSGVLARSSGAVGGRFDVIGEGALLLRRPDPNRPGGGPFFESDRFASTGKWVSRWIEPDGPVRSLSADIRIYGQPLEMDSGWTKFSGNPLVTARGGRYATDETLQLPDSLLPHDQALVRGTGPYAGKWLLLFDVNVWETGGWEAWNAVGGWAAAVADSLAPLKRGVNPFRLIEPYPLFPSDSARATFGYHAPNDFLYVEGTWYAPATSRGQRGHLWTSPDLIHWRNAGPMEGVRGFDPGIAYDGNRFHLFTEDGTRLQHMTAADPLGRWTAHGPVLEVGDHTGDADVSFFNNAWHAFFDDAPHQVYTIGHARTAPSAFPGGWTLTNDVYGPRRPDQGQDWDEPIPHGYNWGTGDPDVAIEGTTLYLTHERPTGIAYKELGLRDDGEQTVRLWLEGDTDGDRSAEWTSEHVLRAGRSRITLDETKAQGRAERIRLSIRLTSRNPRESPMVRSLRLRSAAP